MRIVCLVGIWDFPTAERLLWLPMKAALAGSFPAAEIVVAHRTFAPWQRARIRAYTDEVVQTYDDGVPLLLLGFSMGGLVANGAARQFQRSRVIGIVSLCAPLALRRWWGLRLAEGVPQVSISGRLDLLGWLFGRAPGVPVRWLWADHFFTPVFVPGFSRRVVKLIKQEFSARGLF